MTVPEHDSEYSNESLRRLGARIRHYRRKRAMTQRDLSFPGCSYSYLARIEAGDRRPSPRVLYEIARRLDVPAEELTGETSTEQRSRSLEALEAAMLTRQGRLEEAEETLQGVLHEARVSADAERISEACEGLGLVALARGDSERASALLHEALESASDPDPGERIDLHAGLIEVYRTTGDSARAMALIEDCLAQLRRSPAGDPAKFVRYSLWLSAACLEVGDPARAAVALADALAEGRGSVDLESRAIRLFELARAHAAAGRTELAIRHSDRALSMYELAEDNEALRDAHLAYAQSLLDASDAVGAAEHLTAARAMARDGGGAIDGTLAVEEARLALLSGDTETAADRARVAVETLGAATDAQRIGDAYLVLARVQDSLGEIERAEQAYAAAIAAFERAGDRRALSRAHRYHGKFLKRLGRSEAALDAFERASDLAPSTAPGMPVVELH